MVVKKAGRGGGFGVRTTADRPSTNAIHHFGGRQLLEQILAQARGRHRKPGS